MRFLTTIINSLNKEEVRFYKLFVNRTAQKKARKDVVVFDFFRKKKSDANSKALIEKLNISPNNYYQIKSRLYNDLNNSMIWQHISKDQQSKAFSFVLLSRIYKNKGELDVALDYLKIAEREAKKVESYEILSIVYSEIVELSHELISIDVDHYIALKKDNSLLIQEIEKIDVLIAKLMYDIKTKQNFAKSDPLLINTLSTYFQENNDKEMVLNSPRFRLRLFRTYSRLLLQKSDFQTLEKFLLKTYSSFLEDELFTRANHNDKLTLLTYLTNCLYKTKKYSTSLEYAHILEYAMKEHDGFLSDKYLFYYYNALVLNYAVEDKDKALEVLNEAKKNEAIKKLPAYTTFIYLNTSLLYYQKKMYVLAAKNISRLIQQEDFLSLDKGFQLKLLIAELIIRSELGQNDIISDQIGIINANYKSTISEGANKRDAEVLKLLLMMAKDKNIQNKVATIVAMMSDEASREADIISYNDWMKTI